MEKLDSIYAMLGLSDNASVDEVKKSYRRFVKKNHPDLFPGNKYKEEKFKNITAAYHDWKLIESAVSELRRAKRDTHGFNGYVEFCQKYLKKKSVDYRV
jgi:curved DNA-binding protein CbpA